jgi:hypothetical protein
MEPVVRESFFVHVDSSANILTQNLANDFVYEMRVSESLPDGKFEVALSSASFPPYLNVKYEENLSFTLALVTRQQSRMIIHDNVKTFRLHDEYCHDLKELCDALNALTEDHILQDETEDHTIELKNAFKFKAITNKQVYLESYNRSTDVGIRIVFSPNLQALLGCSENTAYVFENTRILYAPRWQDTYDPAIIAPFVDKIITEMYVTLDIIEEVYSRQTEHRQTLKVMHLKKSENMIVCDSEEPDFHRLTIRELRSFRIKITDQYAKPFPFACNGYSDKTLLVLHFKSKGIGFKGTRPEDRPIVIAKHRL